MLLAFAVRFGMKQAILLAIAAVICASAAGQNNFKVIHSFSGYPNDGSHPTGPVVFDKLGNMYGSAPGGSNGGCGDLGCGVVYELSPDGHGNWTETILYNFCENWNGQTCLDGTAPTGGLALDAAGNLYGVAIEGGTGVGELSIGGGVAFELSPPSQRGGAWTETVLYNFCNDLQGNLCLDGLAPASQPVFDSSGNLYGTTAGGGTGHLSLGGGTVFELSPGVNSWTEKILYNFCSQGTGDNCPDGEIPSGGVTFDKSGNLFGTTDYSGNSNTNTGGTVYELSSSAGGWKYRRLLEVPARSKSNYLPGAVSFDGVGNLYSTFGAPDGGVFKLNPSTRKLEVFSFNGQDGQNPQRGVLIDARTGALYGTTAFGGGSGNIYRINSNRKETVLHNFCALPNCVDGELPWPAPMPDASGNLYGTAGFGGEYGAGVVYSVSP